MNSSGRQRIWLHTILAAGLLLCSATGVQAEKTARSRPQLRVASDWPTGSVNRVRLVNDGQQTWLYAAGVGKVVRRWEVTGRAGNRSLRPAGEFVWPMYRAERGVILALDVLGGGRGVPGRIAVGGAGTLAPQVAFSRSDDPDNVQVLSDPVTQNNSRQYVFSVAFSPQGNLLAVGEQGFPVHDRGRVLLWDVSGADVKFAGRMNIGAETVKSLSFSPDGAHLLTVGPRPPVTSGETGSLVEIWQVNQLRLNRNDGNAAPAAPRSQTFYRAVDWADCVLDSACWVDNRSWAAATIAGVVRGGLDGNRDAAAETRMIMPPYAVAHRGRNAQQFPFCEFVNTTDVAVSLTIAGQPITLQPGRSHRENNPAAGAQFSVQGSKLTNPVRNGDSYRICFESWGIRAIPGTSNVVAGVWDGENSRLVIQDPQGNLVASVPGSIFRQRELYALDVMPGAAGQPALLAAAGVGGPSDKPNVQLRLWELNGNGARQAGVFPPAGAATGGPVRAVAVTSNGRGFVWHHDAHPADGKFRLAFDPAQRAFGKLNDPNSFTGLDPEVPVVTRDKVLRIDVGGRFLDIDARDPTRGNPVHRFNERSWFIAEEVEDPEEVKDDQGREYYKVRASVPNQRGSFFHVLKAEAREVTAVRTHGLKPSEQRTDNGLAVATPSAPHMDGQRVLQQLTMGQFFTPLQFSGDWIQVLASGQKGWLHKDSIMGAEQWAILDGRGREIARFPVPKGNRPLCATRLELDGQDFMAIGHQRGICVWDVGAVKAGRGRGGLLRAFYGHSDRIQSLSFSPDGRWLLSGSDDGTMCGWSLEGMLAGNELGGITIDANGRITSKPEKGSPAWEAGFEQGQTVRSVSVAGKELQRADWARALARPVPGDELLVGIQGGAEHLMTPVRRDQLWSFYPFHDQEWVLWSPLSVYDSSAHVARDGREERLKFQTNLVGNFRQGQRGVDSRRIFTQPAADHAGVYRNDGLMRDLVRSLQVPETMLDIPSPPKMQLVLSNGRNGVPAQAVLTATAVSPDEQVVSRAVFVNGLQVSQAGGDAAQPSVQATLNSAAFRSGMNRVVGVAQVQSTSGSTFTFRVVQSFEFNRPAPRQARLHYLGIGVNKPPEQLQRLGELKYAGSGVRELGNAVRKAVQQGQVVRSAPLRAGTHQLLADGAPEGDQQGVPTLAAARTAFQQLAADADPDDLAVIFLAGHGEVGANNEFEFVLRDEAMKQSELTALLGRLPCRTLLILDTCHAGSSAGSRQQVQLFSNIVNGPLVVTACAAEEESIEHDGIKSGFFTAALLEALTGRELPGYAPPPSADLSGDGKVSLMEICRFVQSRTPQLVTRTPGLTGDVQSPQFLQSTSFDDADAFTVR